MSRISGSGSETEHAPGTTGDDAFHWSIVLKGRRGGLRCDRHDPSRKCACISLVRSRTRRVSRKSKEDHSKLKPTISVYPRYLSYWDARQDGSKTDKISFVDHCLARAMSMLIVRVPSSCKQHVMCHASCILASMTPASGVFTTFAQPVAPPGIMVPCINGRWAVEW